MREDSSGSCCQLRFSNQVRIWKSNRKRSSSRESDPDREIVEVVLRIVTSRLRRLLIVCAYLSLQSATSLLSYVRAVDASSTSPSEINDIPAFVADE